MDNTLRVGEWLERLEAAGREDVYQAVAAPISPDLARINRRAVGDREPLHSLQLAPDILHRENIRLIRPLHIPTLRCTQTPRWTRRKTQRRSQQMGTFTARLTMACGTVVAVANPVAGAILAVAAVVGAAALLVHNAADLRDGLNRF